jgi:hypothetical protein
MVDEGIERAPTGCCGCFGGGGGDNDNNNKQTKKNGKNSQSSSSENNNTKTDIESNKALKKKKKKKLTSFGRASMTNDGSAGGESFHDADDGIIAPDYAVEDRNESFKPYAHHLHPILGNTSGDTSMKGSSIPRYDTPVNEPLMGKPSTWSGNAGNAASFQLRGKNYKRDKKKFRSQPSSYEVKQLLVFRSEKKVIDVHEKVFGKKVGELIRNRVPTVLIVNVMIPDYAPDTGVFGKLAKVAPDGQGHQVCMVCTLADWAREAFENTKDWKDLPPELSLLLRYIEGEDGKDGFDPPPHSWIPRQKTKVVVMVKGGQHELPWPVRMALSKGNGRPFMTDRTGNFTKRGGCFEVDIDGHNFKPLATNSLRTCHAYFKYLILDIGIVIQGEDEKELPERLLTCLRVSYPDLEGVTASFENIEKELTKRTWIDWNKLKMREPGSSFKILPLPSLRSMSLSLTRSQPKAPDSPRSVSGGGKAGE